MHKAFKSGYVALIGAPNAGKSTLLNRFLGQKISITSRRPQTTRHRILGIHSRPDAQLVYVDTPGMHVGGKKALNRYLNKTADASMVGVDVVVWLKEKASWDDADQWVLNKIKDQSLPVILVLNKIDRVDDKAGLMPLVEVLSQKYPFTAIVPVSALHGTQVDELEEVITKCLPEGEALFPEDQITDRSERFIAAEVIREKLIRRLGQEIPHALSIRIEQFKVEGALTRIHAEIWVEREGQKNIVIGRKGIVLKEVGAEARHEIESMLESKVYLNLWVKVKKGWSNSEQAMLQLGYLDSGST